MAGQALNYQTKHLIIKTIRKKMQTKSLKDITIREIIESCGISRHTFYYHFEDIYAAVKWMYEMDATALMGMQVEKTNWHTIVQAFFNYLEQNRAVCLCTLNSPCYKEIKNVFYQIAKSHLQEHITVIAKQLSLDTNTKFQNFLTHSYIISFEAIIESWFSGEINCSSVELVTYMDQTLDAQIRMTLQSTISIELT